MDHDKLVDRIAKLLRQAESVDGTPEADMFRSRAFELLAKHGIDEAMVEEQQRKLTSSLPPEAIVWKLTVTGSWAQPQLMLLNALGHALHCDVAYYTGTPVRVLVYGMERHIDRMKILWEILQPEMLRQVKIVRPPASQYHHAGRTRAYRRAWIAGFASGIGTRLRAQEEAAIESAGSTALVLYKDDKKRATEKMHADNPFMKTVKRAGFDAAGYRQGHRDSQNAALNRQVG